MSYDLRKTCWLIDADISQLEEKKSLYSIDIIPVANS